MPADLEAKLRSLTLKRSAVDPLTAAFAAGASARRRTAVRWRAVAAVLAVVATIRWAVVDSTPKSSPPIVVARSEPSKMTIDSSLRQSWRVRDDLLARGLDAIPSTPLPPPPKASAF